MVSLLKSYDGFNVIQITALIPTSYAVPYTTSTITSNGEVQKGASCFNLIATTERFFIASKKSGKNCKSSHACIIVNKSTNLFSVTFRQIDLILIRVVFVWRGERKIFCVFLYSFFSIPKISFQDFRNARSDGFLFSLCKLM